MLVSGREVGPPVVFRDGDVGNLETAEALLPPVGVLNGGVSKILVEGGRCLGKDFEAGLANLKVVAEK